ncbi:MAG: hypothetical protein RB148_12015 [Armatimonadota bacterium]|nr:hypothetical protein [Armatimonadota bacterium]
MLNIPQTIMEGNSMPTSLQERALRAYILQRDRVVRQERTRDADKVAHTRATIRALLYQRLGIDPAQATDVEGHALVEVDGLQFGLVHPLNQSNPFLALEFGPCQACGRRSVWAAIGNLADLGRALTLGARHFHVCHRGRHGGRS